MSSEINILYYGDVDIKASTDNNGDGDLSVANKVSILGNVPSTTTTSGSLVVTGGAGISGSIFVGDTLDVAGLTTLKGTDIDLITDDFTAGGANDIVFTPKSFNLTSAEASSLTTTTGDITVEPFATLNLGGAAISAVTDTFTVDADTITTTSAVTTINNVSTGAGENLTLELSGATDSQIALISSGTGASAISLTTSVGGITTSAEGALSLQSATSVSMGTAANVPITIGHTSSTVTVGNNLQVDGNLNVSGTTTTINTEVLTFEDNIVVYNSAPNGIADGGLAVKRWQTVDGLTNDVLSDDPNETSTVHGGLISDPTATTVTLAAGASATDGFYNGWWIEIVATGQVRRIQSYVGATKVATIFATGDTDESYPDSPLDFVTPAGNDGSAYNLYGNNFIASVYREATDTWAIFSVPREPDVSAQLTPLKYMNFEANDITSFGSVFTDIIEGQSGTAVTISDVTIDSGDLTGVTSINGSTPDSIDIVTLANDTVAVEIPSTGLIGSYFLLVESDGQGGSIAQFSACKAVSTSNVSPNRLAVSRGSNNERVICDWDADEKIKLLFQNIPGVAGPHNYKIKIISV